jgi:HAD superfamily hydrolase (TIGR01509 family)
MHALLFDLDGTLVNTDPIHYRGWRTLLQPYGLEIDPAFYRTQISGRLNLDVVSDLLPTLSPDEALDLITRKEALFRDMATRLAPIPGLMRLLEWAKFAELGVSLVTHAPRLNAEFMLAILQLESAFSPILLSEEIAVGKPDPAPYRQALQRLNLTAKEALVFEDSPSAVQAASQAGIPTIGIATTHEPDELEAAGAKLVIQDYTDPILWMELVSALPQFLPQPDGLDPASDQASVADKTLSGEDTISGTLEW